VNSFLCVLSSPAVTSSYDDNDDDDDDDHDSLIRSREQVCASTTSTRVKIKFPHMLLVVL
jgi:hypothetical protein